jgi:hypothetical protein
MSRRLLYGGFGIVALSFVSVVLLRTAALNAADASASNKSADVIARLESRIAGLEARIAMLEKERAPGGIVFQNQLTPPTVIPPVAPQVEPKEFDGNWCYTILIDGKTQKVQR